MNQLEAIVLGFVLGFPAGALAGHWLRIRRIKESDMDAVAQRSLIHRLNDRFGAYILAVSAVITMLTVVGYFYLSVANHRQDLQRAEDQKTRTADNSALIKCFDAFATQLAGGLPPVRQASAQRDAALRAALGPTGLEGTLVKLSKNEVGPTDVQSLITALEAYQVAEANLSQARADNPYPPPPSEFCKLPSARP